MSLKKIHTEPAPPISVTEFGDVLVWSDDTFTGCPLLDGDIGAAEVASRFGYGSVADIPSSALTEAWWTAVRTKTGDEGVRFVSQVVSFRNAIKQAQEGCSMWQVWALRNSRRLHSIRSGFKVQAYDEDNDAWRRIHAVAASTAASVEVIAQFLAPVNSFPAFPATAVRLWWEMSSVAPHFDPEVKELWDEFKTI